MKTQGATQYDLTQGKILNKILLVAIPIMGVQLVQMLYNLTDMFWLGRLSSDAVAASGAAGMYMWLSVAFMMLGRMGAEIGVSQSFGRGDMGGARRFIHNALVVAAFLGVIYGGLLVLFSDTLISFFAIREAHVAKDAADYLAVAGIGIPMTFITGALVGVFNGSGNSRVPLFINSIGLLVNMVLDPLFIFTFGQGVKGAAAATVIGQTVVCVVFLFATKWHRTAPVEGFRILHRPDFGVIRQMLKWSVPVGVESLLFTMLSMIISRLIASFGATAMAVQMVGTQIESLSWLIGGGFGSAVTAYNGQNYGAGKWSRIHNGFKISAEAISIWGSIVTLILFFYGRQLFSLFIKEPETIEMGVIYLKILAAAQIIISLEAASSGSFRGLGKTMPPSIISVTSNTLRVPLCYVLSRTALGINGIWWGITIGAMLRGTLMFVFYMRYRRWLPRKDDPGAAV